MEEKGNKKDISWKISTEKKDNSNKIRCQEQCSSGCGGNGRCGVGN